MNPIEQMRDQCAKVAGKYANNAYNSSSQNAAIEIRDLIRALPLPEVEHKPIAWLYHDGEKQFPIPDPRMCTVLMSLTRYVYRNEIALYASPETEALRKDNAEYDKENATLVNELRLSAVREDALRKEIEAARELLADVRKACQAVVGAFDALSPSSAARTEPLQINVARAAIEKAEGFLSGQP